MPKTTLYRDSRTDYYHITNLTNFFEKNKSKKISLLFSLIYTNTIIIYYFFYFFGKVGKE